MKRCPACERAYDDGQTFCMEDGTVLLSDAGFMEPPKTERYEPPPTEIYTPPVSTGSGYAPPSQPGYGPGPGSWEPPAAPRQYAPPVAQPGYAPAQYGQAAPALDQTLAIASLVCGALSIVMFCFSGILGIPAIIMGVMARNRIAADPARYGGGGVAMAGIICGIAGTGIMVLYWILVILGAIASK